MKKLFILDLDNTLIYASINTDLPSNILFYYSKYLTIYERPYAKEFVRKCNEEGDIVVFTTAIHDYAEKVCNNLGIEPVELFSREDCLVINGIYVKSVPDYYFDEYGMIVIIDDMPEIWDEKSHQRCLIIKVSQFYGNADDEEFKKIDF